jgi:hypothetical protein
MRKSKDGDSQIALHLGTLHSVTVKYAYENLSDAQFEELVVTLCQKLLGLATQGFAAGPDGGRDAKFVGTAEHIPSKTTPWRGTVIIQAKHTNGYNKKFSDTDFYSKNNNSCVIAAEIPRIKTLKQTGGLDHYMIFSNQKLTGNAESAIRSLIAKECSIAEPSILLCGIEQIESWLKHFPDVPGLVNLDPIDSPLSLSPDDLAEVVEAFAVYSDEIHTIIDQPPVARVPYEQKNKINNMSAEYAAIQRKRYLADTGEIKRFLAAPENFRLLRLYESIVEEFQLKIVAKRRDYQTFDDVMNYVVDLLFARDETLNRQKRLTRALLFYMYWNCDLGEVDDASPN